MQAPIISFKDFSFQYRAQKQPTLRHINLDIYPGERVLIAGPSGSGKSTLIQHMNGLVHPTCGRVLVGGQDLADKKAAQDDADVQAAVKAVGEALGDTGRILVRESGTEPLVRVMVEAPEHETCEKYVQQVVDVIKAKGYAI